MRARCGRISRTLCKNTLSTGAYEAGMQNNDSVSHLKSGYWSRSVDSGRRSLAYSNHSLALRDISGFRKLFQNRNITTTRILNGSD